MRKGPRDEGDTAVECYDLFWAQVDGRRKVRSCGRARRRMIWWKRDSDESVDSRWGRWGEEEEKAQ